MCPLNQLVFAADLLTGFIGSRLFDLHRSIHILSPQKWGEVSFFANGSGLV